MNNFLIPLIWRFFFWGFFLFIFSACDKKIPLEETVTLEEPVAATDPNILPRTEAAWLKGISFAGESINQADALQNAIQLFLNDPNEETLAAARETWHTAHKTYAQLELFITLGLRNPGLFGQLIPTHFLIDAQPILPGYLDYFEVYADSGIVFDIAMPLNAETLRAQHGFSDATEVSLGFHAIEYLLWGETGERSADDYITVQTLNTAQRSAGVSIIDLPNNRRRVLLNLLSVLLSDDIAQLKQQLENPADAIRRNYSALTPLSRLQLFQAAGYSMLTQRIEWLTHFKVVANVAEAQSVASIPQQTDIASDNDNLQHNQFSGGDLNLFTTQLQTVNNILFDDNIGFSVWILSIEQLPLLEQFQKTIQQLSDPDALTWPLDDKQKNEMITTLTLFAEAIAPPGIEE